MSQVAETDVYRIDISNVKPVKVLGDLRWTGKAKFPGTPRPRSIVIFQLGEDVVAISAFCPHEQADLSEGRFVEPYVIECPLHQNRYDLRTGAIKTFSVEMEGEQMYLLWRRSNNEPVVPQLTQIRLKERSQEEQGETLQRELAALREAAQVREAHMVETLTQMEGMIREVEDKKHEIERSHLELGKITEFIKRVTDTMSEVLVVTDPKGNVITVNTRFASVLGISRDDAKGMHVSRLVVPELSERGSHRPFDETALSGERDAEVEACLRTKDGRRIEHLVRVAPLYGPSGKREGAVFVCTDIQTVKAAQRELNSAYSKVQNLLDNMKQAVFVVVSSGEIIQPVSRHTARLFRQEVVGKNVFDVLFRDLPRGEQTYSGLMTAFLTTFGAEEFQWDLMVDLMPRRVLYKHDASDPDSGVSVLKVDYCPLYDEHGEMEKLMLIVEDVTKVEQLEREQQSNQLRTQILEELAKNRTEDLREFLATAHTQLREARHKLEQRDVSERNAFFRLLHTLKGNARVLGLSLIARATHETETAAEPLRNPEADNPVLREEVRDALVDLQRQLAEYAAVAEHILRVPNEIEVRGCSELHRAVTALDAEVPQLVAGLRNEKDARAVATSLEARALTCREAADTLVSDDVRKAAKAFQHVIALFTHPQASVDSGIVADLHRCHEKLVEAALTRRVSSQTAAAYSLSTSGWTSVYLDIYALTCAVYEDDGAPKRLLTIERAAERAMSSAGTLRAEFLPALLAKIVSTAHQSRERGALTGLVREAWRHVLLHSTLESLALLRVEERSLLLSALAESDKGDGAWVALLEAGRVRTGSVVGFFGALRRSGTPAIEVLKLLSSLFDDAGIEQVAKMFVSSRGHELDELSSLLKRVDAHTQAISFDTWAVELGAPFSLFSHSPRLGLGYLKRLDILRLVNAVQELVLGNFQLLFERVQTVEVMAYHFSQLQRRLREYKQDKTEGSLDALEETIAQLLYVPVIPSLYKYSSMVTEIAERLGKRASLQLLGDTTTALPREHLYPLHDALVHLLRNGIDHGLETPEERTRAGKPERGTIEIECALSGDQVKLVLRDDGRGIDPFKVRQKALELKLISESTAVELSEEQLIDLVFLPHFSTARSVTDISGRGIGMDVVRESLLRIGAQMHVESRVGCGTSFSIFLPRKPLSAD